MSLELLGFIKAQANPSITSKTFSRTPYHILCRNRGDGKPLSLVFKVLSPKERMGGEEAQVTSVADGV